MGCWRHRHEPFREREGEAALGPSCGAVEDEPGVVMGAQGEDRRTEDGAGGQRMGRYFTLILLVASLYGAFRMLQPYIHAIIFAALFASLCRPILGFCQRRLAPLQRMRYLRPEARRETLAALLATAIVAMLVIVPLGLFSGALVKRGVSTYVAARAWLSADREAAANGSGPGEGPAGGGSALVGRILASAPVVR